MARREWSIRWKHGDRPEQRVTRDTEREARNFAEYIESGWADFEYAHVEYRDVGDWIEVSDGKSSDME